MSSPSLSAPDPDPLIFPAAPVCPECGDETDPGPGTRWRCTRCQITWADDGTDGRRESVASAIARDREARKREARIDRLAAAAGEFSEEEERTQR